MQTGANVNGTAQRCLPSLNAVATPGRNDRRSTFAGPVKASSAASMGENTGWDTSTIPIDLCSLREGGRNECWGWKATDVPIASPAADTALSTACTGIHGGTVQDTTSPGARWLMDDCDCGPMMRQPLARHAAAPAVAVRARNAARRRTQRPPRCSDRTRPPAPYASAPMAPITLRRISGSKLSATSAASRSPHAALVARPRDLSNAR